MKSIEPDPSELLVKALDLAVGASALARYASGHTSDARLRRLFRQFASTSEHQERALRQQLARTGSESAGPGPREVATAIGLGLAALAALGAGIALVARFRGDGGGGSGGDPISRAMRSAGSIARGGLGGTNGSVGSGLPATRGAGY